MPLTKYADEPVGFTNWIEKADRHGTLRQTSKTQNISVDAMGWYFRPEADYWRLKEMLLTFSNANDRDFTISNVTGAYIVKARNDRFWIKIPGHFTKMIVIAPAWYQTAAAFCAAIKAALDGNPGFSEAGLTFTVTYDSAEQLLTIVNSGGLVMSFDQYNTRQGVRRTSTAGNNMGFTKDQGPTATLVSDTPVSIGINTVLVSETTDSSFSYVNTDEFFFDNDSGILVASSVANVIMTAKLVYEAG